jgi:hypothetical protein
MQIRGPRREKQSTFLASVPAKELADAYFGFNFNAAELMQ